MDDGVARVAGHVENLQVRTNGEDLVRQDTTCDAGHDDIGEQEINARQMRESLDRLVTRGRLRDCVTELAKTLDDNVSNTLVVLRNQEDLIRLRKRQGSFFQRIGLRGRLAAIARQVDLHRGAASGFGIKLDVAAALFDETEHLTEAKSGSASDCLGGLERIEGPLDDLRRHASPGVGDGNQHMLAGSYLRVSRCVGLVQKRVGGLDGKVTAVGHGVSRVDAEVEDGVLKLGGVGVRGPHPAGQDRLHLQLLPDRAPQKLRHVSDELVGVDGLRRQRLLAKIAASGPRLDRVKTYYSRGTRVRDGKINGVYEEWGDYRTMAFTNVETFAGVTSTGGFDGKTGWRLGPDGKALIVANPQQLAGTKLSGYLDVQGYFFPDRFPALFTYTGAREAEGRRFDIVVVTPAGGNLIELWLEPRTHRLKRLTGRLGPTSIQGDITQYQTIDGLEIMRTALQTMTGPTGVHTESQSVAVYRFGPVQPERLGIPK